MKNKKEISVGGQAIIEGVMMRGPDKLATAIRRKNGDLELKLPLKSLQETVEQNTRASLAIAWGIVWASVILSTVYLYVNGNMIEARWGLGAAIITGLIFIGKTRNNDRKRVLRHPEGIKKIR